VARADYSSGMRLASALGIASDAGESPRGLSARPLTRSLGTVPERNQRGVGHGERGGLRHLQALRAVHAPGDPPVDLVEELVDQDVRRDLLQHTAVRVDEADVAAAGDPEVRVARLAWAVHRAAEHRDLEVLRVVPKP